jgi:hypothetical protein
MNIRLSRALGIAALITVGSAAPTLAQAPAAAGTSEPSMSCRLFPLACPGPTPPKPEPLLGTPEEQTEAAAPPPAERPVKHRRQTHKQASTHAAQPAVLLRR